MRKKIPKRKDRPQSRDFSVVGMQYRVTLPVRRELAKSCPFSVHVIREPDNRHDENAIAIEVASGTNIDGMKIGYLRRQVAEVLAPALDSGEVVDVRARMVLIDPEVSEAVVRIWLAGAKNSTLDKIAS
jgi:hypothetical protein